LALASVIFQGGEYYFCGEYGSVYFNENTQHKLLLDYVSKDLSRLPTLLEQYVSKKMDIRSFELLDYEYEYSDSTEIMEILKSAHPYYAHEFKEVFVKAIGDYLNDLFVKARYENHHTDWNSELKGKDWYVERFKALAVVKLYNPIERLKAIEELTKTDKQFQEFDLEKQKHEKAIAEHQAYESYNVDKYADEFYEKYNPENNVPHHVVARGFSNELATQEYIKSMLWGILDLTAPKSIATLSIPQRAWLYMDIFAFEYEHYEIDATKKLSLRRFTEKHDYSPKVKQDNEQGNEKNRKDKKIDFLFKPNYGLKDFYINHEHISPEALGALNNAAVYARKIISKGVYEEYEIIDLRQLLFLEIMLMIEADIMVKKCKNCGMYFAVTTNRKKAFCDRVADGETKPCSVVGRNRTFQENARREPALEIYLRACKRQNARFNTWIKNGTRRDKTDLKTWRKQAKVKLEQVRAKELDVAEFEKWLQKHPAKGQL
jgi:hypothetical protein